MPRARWRAVHRLTALLLGALLLGSVLGACSSGEPAPIISALHFFEQGNKAFADEHWDGAILNFKKAIALEERVPDFHYNLGITYFQVQAWDLAVAEFSRTVELNPGHADAHLNLALTYDRQYKRQLAHQHFNRYQELTLAQAAQEAQGDAVGAAPAGAAKDAAQRGQPAADQALAARQAPTEARQPPPDEPVTPARRVFGQPSQPTGDTGKWWTQDRFLPNP